MKIIAVSGWKRSGKDMVAEYLVDKHGFRRRSFADRLKDMAAEQYGLPRHHFDDASYKESPCGTLPVVAKDTFSVAICELLWHHFRDADGNKPINFTVVNGMGMGQCGPRLKRVQLYQTPRSIAVFEGSGKRSIDANYWIFRVLDAMEENGLYVMSDVRFKNEMVMLKEHAGVGNVITIRMNRFDTTTDTDASERDLDDYAFDYTINNKEPTTKEQVFALLEEILKVSLNKEKAA